MSSSSSEFMWVAFLVLTAFAALTFLRMLAVYRQNEIETYDLVREAKQVRAEFVRRRARNGAEPEPEPESSDEVIDVF